MYIYTYIHTCMHTHLCSRSQKDVFDDLDEEMTFGARGVYNIYTYLLHVHICIVRNMYVHMYIRIRACTQIVSMYIHL
jgi:hypothetical protein